MAEHLDRRAFSKLAISGVSAAALSSRSRPASAQNTPELLTPHSPMFARRAAGGRVAAGADDFEALQAMFDFSAEHSVGWRIPAGLYSTSRPLTVRQPSKVLGPGNIDRNFYNLPPVSWEFDAGCIIRAAGAMDALITFGGIEPDWSQYLHNAVIRGGVFDANFLARVCVRVPFFNTIFIEDQQCRNYVLRGWEMGALNAPAPSAGSCHQGCTTWRDTQPFRAEIKRVEKSFPCVVVAPSHRYPVGAERVVSLSNMTTSTGQPLSQTRNAFFEIKIVSPDAFELKGVDSSRNWLDVAPSGQAYLTFPSMRLPRFIRHVSNGKPCVVSTTGPHGLLSGEPVFIADVGGMPQLDGVYAVTAVEGHPERFSVDVDSSRWAPFDAAKGPGSVMPWVDPDTVETGVYYLNATDADDINCEFVGNRICFRSNPSKCGYDGKHIKCHHYNFNEHGEIFTAYDVGGDNAFSECQIDGPFRYAFLCREARNRAVLCETNYSGGQAYDRYASPVRLERNGQLTAAQCDWKAMSKAFRLLKGCSGDARNYRETGMDYLNVYVEPTR